MRKTSIKIYDEWVEQLVQKIFSDVEQFSDTSISAANDRKARAEKDLSYFCRTYLPHYFPDPDSPEHKKLKDSWKAKNEFLLWEAFRGFGKSTDAHAYLLHDILFRKIRYAGYSSFTQDKAALHLAIPRIEIKYNPRIKNDFAIKMSDRDEAVRWVTNNGVCCQAYGRKQNPRGDSYLQFRHNLWLFDDFESDEHVRNPEITKKGLDWIFGQAIPACDIEWRAYFLGTPMYRRTVLSHLRKNPAVKKIKIPAIKDGRATWPKRFPLKKLNEIKRLIGRTRFNREYLLLETDEEAPFQPEDFKYYAEKSGAQDTNGWTIIGYLDPSVGEELHHNGKAFQTIGTPPNSEKTYLLDDWGEKCSIEKMILNMYEKYKRYKHDIIGIEINAMPLLKSEIRKYEKIYGFSLPLRQFRAVKNKKSRIINTLEGPVQRGDLLFSKDQEDGVINELLEIENNGVEDDRADALEGAYAVKERKAFGRIDEVIIL